MGWYGDNVSLTDLPIELLQEIVVHVAETHLSSVRALATTCRTLVDTLAVVRIATPKTFYWTAATHVNAAELARFGALLGAFEPAAMAVEATLRVMYTVVVWAVDDPTVASHRNLAPGILDRCGKQMPIAPMMRLLGLPGPHAAPPAVLLRWITSTYDVLEREGGPSLFAASAASAPLAPAAVGKYANRVHDQRTMANNAIYIRCKSARPGLFLHPPPPSADFDLLHTIDVESLARIASVDGPVATKWIDYGARCAVQETAIARPDACRRAVLWVDDQVAARLPTRPPAPMSLLPRLSDLFAIEHLRVLRCRGQRMGMLIGSLVPRFDVSAFVESAERLASARGA